MKKTKEEQADEYGKRNSEDNGCWDLERGFISGYTAAETDLKSENERLRKALEGIAIQDTATEMRDIAKEALS